MNPLTRTSYFPKTSGGVKKFLFVAVPIILFALAPHTFAQGFVPLAPIEGLTKGVTADSSGLATFFNNLYKFLIGIAAAIAVIEIIWGGLEISTKDSVSKQSDGKARIQQAILGLVLVLSPVLVFSIINPNILNLSLNLKPIDLTYTRTEPPPPVLPPCVQGRTTNCTPVKPNDVAEGLYDKPQSKGWCYKIIFCATNSCVSTCGASGCSYMCGNQTQCENAIKEDPNKAPGSSCALYP